VPGIFYSVLFIAIMLSQSFAVEDMRCGTMHFAENFQNMQRKMSAKIENCDAWNLYEQVYSKRSTNFIIYYTKDGPHAVKTEAYIDSLAIYLEQAYKHHRDSLGMKHSLGTYVGIHRTWHYQQIIPAGLYPVEVLDLGLLRGTELHKYAMTYGITFAPDSRYPKVTQIAIENDFLRGANCSGAPSTIPFTSDINGDYSRKWHLALKVTVFHELYHSFQYMYFNMFANGSASFWMETSAVGVEEIGAPEINDYIAYLRNVFFNPGISMENPPNIMYIYGYAPLYLFLYSKFGSKFDSYILDSFSKYPKMKFAVHLARLADSLGIDEEELFHEYAKSVFFSGRRTSAQQASAFSFWPDQYMWPAWGTRSMSNAHSVLPDATIDFIRVTSRDRKPSTDSAKISILDYGDSSVWVLSRLLESEYVPLVPQKPFVAYPNPWNPKKNSPVVRFANLPPNAKGVEIRSANGAFIEKIHRKSENEEEPLIWEPNKFPAPGILYYRALPNGKNKVLIVQF
jgi:hypothetical protein